MSRTLVHYAESRFIQCRELRACADGMRSDRTRLLAATKLLGTRVKTATYPLELSQRSMNRWCRSRAA